MRDGKIYKYQTALRYRLRTYQPISDISKGYIKWKKPPDDDGNFETGSWEAVLATSATTSLGIIYVDFTSRLTAWDTSGDWKVWAFANFVGGGSAAGEAVTEHIYEEGE